MDAIQQDVDLEVNQEPQEEMKDLCSHQKNTNHLNLPMNKQEIFSISSPRQ